MLNWGTKSFFFLCEVKYDAIIFDLGGVLINVDYNKTICAFEELGTADFSLIFSQAKQTDIFSQYETGKISSQRFINELLAYLPSGTTPNQVVHAWNQMIQNVPAESILLLERLKRKYAVFMLSNTNELHVPLVRKEWAKVAFHPMEHYFNTIYFSHELGMRKPHPEIFIEVCEREKLMPQTTLFIDDTLQHIEGAKSAGLLTHHLKDIRALYELFS
jgi:HAD superfamily hydrolase (TIGR01509 family)